MCVYISHVFKLLNKYLKWGNAFNKPFLLYLKREYPVQSWGFPWLAFDITICSYGSASSVQRLETYYALKNEEKWNKKECNRQKRKAYYDANSKHLCIYTYLCYRIEGST